jgi:hypothetical protein
MHDKAWYNAIKQLENRGLLKRDKSISWMDMVELSDALKVGYKNIIPIEEWVK